ncbi:MAG: transposase, partial [bacterium]|nr:transposase [bacterium]
MVARHAEQVAALQEQNAVLQEQVAALQEQVAALQEQNAVQREQIQALRDEIARLKGHKPKPTIRPSRLNEGSKKDKDAKRPGSAKRGKTAEIEIHETVVVGPKEQVPEGSRFKGYADFTVVGVRFEPHNVCYRLEMWEGPDGRRLNGELPEALQFVGGHFSPVLVSYIQHQHYHAGVPQNLIVEQLHDIGVAISAGQVNRILLEKAESFHAEKESLLQVGLEVSRYIQTDDTGARHKGRNGYCTHVGNAWFAYFASTGSKSRINFLGILRAGHTDYVLDAYAREYMRDQRLPKKVLRHLEGLADTVVPDDNAWVKQLRQWGVVKKRHVKIVTEGALL